MYPKPFTIPAYWSAEQAMAVFELLDELRDHIWARYELQLIEAYSEQYQPPPAAVDARAPVDGDDPF